MEFVCMVNRLFWIVFCIDDVWFNIDKPDVVNSRESRVVLEFVNVGVDTVWVEWLISNVVGRLDE